MIERTSTRLWIFPVALLALLLVGMTATSVAWHHHDGSTGAADTRCPICHLSHQPIDTPAAANHAPTLALVAAAAALPDAGLAPSPSVRREPARAPPSA